MSGALDDSRRTQFVAMHVAGRDWENKTRYGTVGATQMATPSNDAPAMVTVRLFALVEQGAPRSAGIGTTKLI